MWTHSTDMSPYIQIDNQERQSKQKNDFLR